MRRPGRLRTVAAGRVLTPPLCVAGALLFVLDALEHAFRFVRATGAYGFRALPRSPAT